MSSITMKGQNTSWKRYSSCVTLNHCLLTFLIVILSLHYSHGFVPSFRATEDQEPPEWYPKKFGDLFADREFPPEDVTIKPSQEKHPSTMNLHTTFRFESSEESPRTTVHHHTEDVTTTTMSPLLLYHYPEPILNDTPKAPEDSFFIRTDYVHSTTVQYPHENRLTEYVTTMKTQESIWISDSSTAGTLTEVDTYTDPTYKDTPKTPKDNFPGINDGITPTIHVSDSSTGDITVILTPDLIWLPKSPITTPPTTTESTAQTQTSHDVLVPTSTEGDSKTFEPSVDNFWPTVKCDADEFSCHSKRLCIRPHLVCDGINDCDDGSDELPCPNVTSIIDPALDCENGECPRSYERNPGECNCQCLGDSRCAAWVYGNPVCTYRKGEVPLLVFSTLNDLFQANLPENRTEVQVIQRNMGHRNLYAISAFAFRAVEKLLIWFDSIENKIFTGRVNLEQAYLIEIHGHQVVIGGTHKIHAFVYDGINYSLIWIDDYGIRSEKLHETSFIAMNQTKLYRTLDPSYDRPGAITIDVEKQCIFWTNIGPNRSNFIERIDISGEPRTQKIVENNIWFPVGLAIDTKNTKVYWIDSLLGTLNSVGYDGTNRIILYESLSIGNQFLSMDIFSNYLYFTDKINSTIQRININNAVKKVDTLISVPNGPPTWVKIVNPTKRRRKSYVRLLSLFPKNPKIR